MDEFLGEFFPAMLKKKLRTAADNNAYCKYNDQRLQAFTSSLYITTLVASLLASHTTRHYGRKATMLVAGVVFCLGVALTASAQKLTMLIVGRILLGWSVGFANQAVPLYLSEMALVAWRGALNILFQLAVTIGILFANLVNYDTEKMLSDGWRVSLAIARVLALLTTLGGIILPNTPNSLVQHGKLDAGLRVLQCIRDVKDVDQEFQDILLKSYNESK